MIDNIILLIIGFMVLIKGADYFVDGASNLAGHFKLSKMLVGLTIVAFGTSAPELAVSIQAMLNNTGEIVIGNVVGSNIINILLILGVSAIICTLTVKSNTVKKEIPILFLLTLIFSTLFLDKIINSTASNIISRSDGIVIVLCFVIFVYYLISMMRKKQDNEQEVPNLSRFKSLIYIVLGLIAVILSSDLVVKEAIILAEELNVTDRIISLTVIALGTSLPELVTSITAAKKKETDILIGNIIGSNIFNICIVLGVPVALFGEIQLVSFRTLDFIVMILASAMIYLFAANGYKIKRAEGIILLITFVIYYGYILFI